MKVNGFYVSAGNSKVRYPIVNLGSGIDCPSRSWCPFSRENYKRAGRRLCYAQKIEMLRHRVLASRRQNEKMIREGSIDPVVVAEKIAAHFARRGAPYGRIVRLNESGDLAPENIMWAVGLIQALRARRIKVYAYSKARQDVQNQARAAGAVVLHSERDFIAVKAKEDTALTMCPGVCGPCRRCPLGKRSAVLEH